METLTWQLLFFPSVVSFFLFGNFGFKNGIQVEVTRVLLDHCRKKEAFHHQNNENCYSNEAIVKITKISKQIGRAHV